MKKLYGYLICFICILTSQGIAAGDAQNEIGSVKKSYETDYKKDEILVKYKPSRSPLSEKTAQTRSGFSEIKTFRKTGIKQIKITGDMDVEQALKIYKHDPNVEYAEPNFRYHISAVPNDPYFEKQWALNNTGQIVNNAAGTEDADIDAPEAWDITTGSHDVIVAFIDTGVDYNHPDLSSNIWINQGEIPGNGIDDDGNNRVDDVHGWDFVDSDNDPMDYNDHGTHVAGIIAAVGNNGIGVAGVAWTARVMVLRGFDTKGYGNTSDLIEAIEYATEKGADVINISWGGWDYSQALKDAIEASSILVVCSAGNDGTDNDVTPNYPSSYDSPNIISVAASDQWDLREYYSNYGDISVDLNAPGTNIYSTVPARETIWADNFDDGNMAGWTTGGTNNTWNLRSYFSSQPYGLMENPVFSYKDNTDSWVKSPPFSLLNKKGVRLDFKVEGHSQKDHDFLYVQISSNGTDWTDCELIDGDKNFFDRYIVDMKEHEGKETVYIRFRFISDGSVNDTGFCIDDISVSASSESFDGTEYDFMEGTSMSAAYVSGVAVLIKTVASEKTATETKAAILDCVDQVNLYPNLIPASYRLNAHISLIMSTTPCETISISVPEIAAEGDGVLQDAGTVNISSPIDEDLVVRLISSDSSKVTVPSSVTIEAGKVSADFDITIIDNNLFEGTRNIFISLFECPGTKAQIQVNDNETAAILTVEMPANAAEGDGALSQYGTVSCNLIAEKDIFISLTSDNNNKLLVQESVVINAGESSVPFWITVLDDSINDGMQSVTVTAKVPGFISGRGTITITDNDNAIWIDDTESENLTGILRDDIRDVIYLADAHNRQLVIIDSISLKIITRLNIDSNFSDMSISKDKNTMVIAGGTLFLVNLETFEIRKLSTELNVFSAAFDHRGYLMLLTSDNYEGIYQYDPFSEEVVKSFGANIYIYDGGYLKTNEAGDTLYAANKGVSPGSIYMFDISGETPVLLAEEEHGEIGDSSNFILSPRFNEIYIPDGYMEIFDSNTLKLIKQFEDEHQIAAATDTEGNYLYGISWYNVLYQYDIAQRELEFHYNLQKEEEDDAPQRRGIAIDRSGKKAFIINGFYDGDTPRLNIQVVELDFPLNFSIPESAIEGEGLIKDGGVITVLQAPLENMTISLTSDDNTEVLVPASVIIPAGEKTVKFDITIIDDSILDGTKSVTVTANVPGFPPFKDIIDVYDNESAELTLDIPETVSEGDGLLPGQGTVSVNRPVEDDVIVGLSADIRYEIIFPQKVLIPTGQTSAVFDLYVIDDSKIESDHGITVTAFVEGWGQDQKTVSILDNDVAKLTIESTVTLCEGDGIVEEGGIIRISGTFPYGLEVTLSSSDTTEITVPSSVIIPALQDLVTFDITVIDDNEKDGTQSAAITAKAEGFIEASLDLIVNDDDNVTWIDGTMGANLTCILRDDIRDAIYLGDASGSQLIVIDSKSLEVILRLPIDSSFSDMAISKDNRTMAIAGGTLFLVDLETFTTRQLSTSLDVLSVAFDNKGRLMLLSSEQWGFVYHYDPEREMIIKSFGTGPDLNNRISRGLLKTDMDGDTLYIATIDSSPASLCKIDLSGKAPVFIADSDYEDTGSFIKDFYLSSSCDEIYVASEYPSGIQVVDSNTLDLMQLLETGTYLAGISNDREGNYVYGLLDTVLYQFNTEQWVLYSHYNLPSDEYNDYKKRKRIAIDRSGDRVFIINSFLYGDECLFKVQVVEINIPVKLSLPDGATEGDGVLHVQGVVSLLKTSPEDLTVFLESGDISKVQVPFSVTIPAGQKSVGFDITILDDLILNGTKSVTITASTSGYPPAVGSIEIWDNETAILTLDVPGIVSEGDGYLMDAGIISVDVTVQDDVVVTLTSDNKGEIGFPSEVTIPAGQTFADFDLNIIDDTDIEGTHSVTINAFVGGWNQAQAIIEISDNDLPELEVAALKTFCEGDGTVSNGGIVTISGTLPSDLEVVLSLDDTTEIEIPSTVMIPALHNSATFDITVIDDTEIDGVQRIEITTEAQGFPDSRLIVPVTDNDNIVWIDETLSTHLTLIMRDDKRDVIYLADPGNSQLVLIDSISLEIIQRISIDSTFIDMDISKDNSTMAVAGGTLFFVDLETLETRKLATDLDVVSVAFDHKGDLMLLTSECHGYIHHYDPDAETVIRSYGHGQYLSFTIYENGLLKTNDRGDMLYVAERGITPVSLYKFDISGETPIFLAEDDRDIGNLTDFIILPGSNEIYVPSGKIMILNGNNLDLIEMLETDNYLGGIGTDPVGYYIYGMPAMPYDNDNNNILYQFDSDQHVLRFHYNILSEIETGEPMRMGIAVDRFGKRAFIIHGDYYAYQYKVEVVELAGLPVYYDQTVNTKEDTEVEISLSVSDSEGDLFTYTIVDQVEHGMLTGDGPNIVYTPDADYRGQDSFSYNVYDGVEYSNIATVTINIVANSPPLADSKSVRMLKDRLVDILLTGSDQEKDSLTFHIVAPPSNGTLSGTPPNLVYTPNSGFSGSDSFTFMVDDGSLDSNVVEISIQVLDKAHPGDVDGSAYLELKDAILALQLSTNIPANTEIYKEADVNDDNRIGVVEAIYILRKVAGMGEE